MSRPKRTRHALRPGGVTACGVRLNFPERNDQYTDLCGNCFPETPHPWRRKASRA